MKSKIRSLSDLFPAKGKNVIGRDTLWDMKQGYEGGTGPFMCTL